MLLLFFLLLVLLVCVKVVVLNKVVNKSLSSFEATNVVSVIRMKLKKPGSSYVGIVSST